MVPCRISKSVPQIPQNAVRTITSSGAHRGSGMSCSSNNGGFETIAFMAVAALDFQLFQIIGAHAGTLEGRAIPHVLFHEIVFQPALFCGFKNRRPLDYAVPDLAERISLEVTGGGLVAWLKILDVQQRKSPGIFAEIGNRALSGESGPEAIHLHLD